MGAWLKVGLALLLVAINGVLVTAEFALVRVRTTRLEALRKSGRRRAGGALDLVRSLSTTLATTQVGITLASLGIGWLGEPAMAELLEPGLEILGAGAYARVLGFVIGFLAITLITVILGELVPKAIGIQRAEPILIHAAPFLRLLRVLLYPIVLFTNATGLAVLKAIGLSTGYGEEAAHSEEELRAILGRSLDRGQITRVGRDILERVFTFSRLTARQIMVPRPDVVWLSARKSPEENMEIARSSGYTRFPYCDGDLDHVMGVVHVKDVISGSTADLRAVMRPPVVVPETATADRLLRLFQRRKQHLAIVVDEYGGASGIVTLEDVVEEIVGEVQDEFDQEPPTMAPLGEGRYRISGTARLEEITKALGASLDTLEDPEIDTIAGYVQAQLGRIAHVGDTVRLGAYELRVEEVKRNRILHLGALPLPSVGASEPTRNQD